MNFSFESFVNGEFDYDKKQIHIIVYGYDKIIRVMMEI